MPGEGTARPRKLADILPEGVFVGTSLILRRGGRFLYGVRAPYAQGARQVIELTGIGGALEGEDGSLTAGALREAREETGCGVRVLAARDTIVVRGEHDIERLQLSGDERPAAVVFRRYRTPPHQPWHEDHQGEACLVVFWGEIDGQPWPAMELPALIWLEPGQVVETARQDVPLSRLLESGAELIESTPGLVPRTVWARLTDSQEALVLALGDKAPVFYETMMLG